MKKECKTCTKLGFTQCVCQTGTQAEKFIASFNFMTFVNADIKEVRFNDGSVARYGFDWAD